MNDERTKDNDKSRLDLVDICRSHYDWFRVLHNIIELEYFYRTTYKGIRKYKDYDIAEVNVTKKFRQYDPFIQPQNTRQVYYLPYPDLCKSSWVVVVKTKLRGCIESDDKIDGQEPYQIDDSTHSKTVVDTDEPITLRSTVINDGIIDRGIDADTFPPEDDDLQEEDEVDGDKEEEDEFDDHKTTSEGEDGESEEKDDESE
ncbi:histone chaperone ASF1-like [Arachis stenosperma]|uniref:histone chaperone ASF1-like n=1 Tax=Arachis stenosperma TaxID=217475 RepID=UPI0025ABC140|nr:histone chaperone ASF1-like [Arachis stenosperma]